MRSRAALCIIVAVIFAAVATPGVTLGQSGSGTDQIRGTPATGTAANTTIAIHPRPNGDARFRVSVAFALDDTNESAAFSTLARRFEDGGTDFSASSFERAANESSVVTGRSMNVTNVTRNATVSGENVTGSDTGRLVLGFTWTNFARTNPERIVVGDAFNTTHGTWLPGLTPNQTLVIEAPRGYAVTRSPVGISNRTLRWEGAASFEPGTPAVRFRRRGARNPPPNGSGNDDPGLVESTPLVVLGVGVVVLGAGAVGAYALRRRDATGERVTANGRAESPSLPSSDAPPENAPTDDAAADATATAPAEEELLSDEERVERLLERNDGRMKQASIVSETGWSNAKVSQLLSAMDEDDRVDKLRIGRENLISLPDEE